MPKLVLGPLLRYVGETQATVWVETDDAARVEVLVPPVDQGGTRPWSRTRGADLRVEGHHYALVLIAGWNGPRLPYRVGSTSIRSGRAGSPPDPSLPAIT